METRAIATSTLHIIMLDCTLIFRIKTSKTAFPQLIKKRTIVSGVISQRLIVEQVDLGIKKKVHINCFCDIV